MYVSPLPPPLEQPALNGTAALCPTGNGMGLFDPLSMISSVLTPISNIIVAKGQEKTEKKKIALEAKALKDQKDQDARDFAYGKAQAQADALTAPSEEKRKEQIIVLSAVGGAAVLIAAIFIMGAVKSRKSE